MPAALGIGLVGTTADFVSWRQPNPLSYRVRIRENLRNQAPIGEVRLGTRVPHASATDCPLPKFDIVTIGHGHLLALTILIGPDRATTIRLPFASVPHTP